MTQLHKIGSLISSMAGGVAIGIIEQSLGMGFIAFCVMLTLFIAMALTAENL